VEKPQFKSIDLTGADYATGFALPDQNGTPRTLKDFAGKVVVAFFGYTQCPDVCPTTMAELAQVKKLLGADGDKFQAIFITVDPERDTAELLISTRPSSPCGPRWPSCPSWPRASSCTTKRSKGKSLAATPWTIQPAAMSMTPRDGFACTAVMAAVPRPWRLTFGCC